MKNTITSTDITLFFRQLSTLISAGIPIINSFEILEKNQSKASMRILIFSIKREMLSGKDFSTCLYKQKNIFDPITCLLITIGEHSGKLDVMLTMIADNKEKHLAFIKNIKQALFYPCMIIITALIVTACLFVFVIPRFAELFSDNPAKLPWLTRCIFYLASKIQPACLLLVLSILLIMASCIPHPRLKPMQQLCKNILTNLPLIKTIRKKLLLIQFARGLSILFKAGIPMANALQLLAKASIDQEYNKTINQLRHEVNAGLQLHQAMRTLSYFPNLMQQMVKVGEESGMLDYLLDRNAAFFESEINHAIKQLNQLLEPLIMLVLGVLIGGLVIGMYLPIFKLGSII